MEPIFFRQQQRTFFFLNKTCRLQSFFVKVPEYFEYILLINNFIDFFIVNHTSKYYLFPHTMTVGHRGAFPES